MLLPTAAAGQVVMVRSDCGRHHFCFPLGCLRGAAASAPRVLPAGSPSSRHPTGAGPGVSPPHLSCCTLPRAMPPAGSGAAQAPSSPSLSGMLRLCKASDHRLGSAAEVFQVKNSWQCPSGRAGAQQQSPSAAGSAPGRCRCCRR